MCLLGVSAWLHVQMEASAKTLHSNGLQEAVPCPMTWFHDESTSQNRKAP